MPEPCCDHSVKWHHDTRGCGYHGHGPARCPCLLTFDEALAQVQAEARGEAGKLLDAWTCTCDDSNPPGIRHLEHSIIEEIDETVAEARAAGAKEAAGRIAEAIEARAKQGFISPVRDGMHDAARIARQEGER